MRHSHFAALAAAALAATLLTGCAQECPDGPPIFYNTEDGQYHFENVGGPLVPDQDVPAGCVAEQQDSSQQVHVDVDVDAPKVKQPKGNTNVKPQAPKPAPGRPAPAPKAGK